MSITIVTEIKLTDLIPIYRDNCLVMISYEDFIKNQTTGGFNICEAIQNCFESGGCFDNTTPNPTDHLPTFSNVITSIGSDSENVILHKSDFTSHYFDADGDLFGKVVVVGGNLAGVTYNGTPIYLGQELFHNEDFELKINRVSNSGYGQEIEIEVYDINNVKAI